MALPGNVCVLTDLSQAQERKNHANDHDQSNEIRGISKQAYQDTV